MIMEKSGLVYVADDEADIRNLVQSFLEQAGHRVLSFETGDKLYEAFEQERPDLVILDVLMPGTDGFEITSKIREISDVPILLLTAKETDTDYIKGFTAGCDDYFTKPFSLVKLMMRVNAILKRSNLSKKENHSLKYGDIEIKPDNKACFIKGEEVVLTKTEFSLMQYLIEKQENGASREELLNEIWGYDACVETRVTDDAIKRIRRKLKDSNSDVLISTIWGYGFRLKIKEKSDE